VAVPGLESDCHLPRSKCMSNAVRSQVRGPRWATHTEVTGASSWLTSLGHWIALQHSHCAESMTTIDVFVSHASEDSSTAIQLASHLESSGYRTWYYERDAVAGVSPLLQIRWAIINCHVVVVVVSPSTVRSHYVVREVVRAMELGKDFIPFLVGLTRNDLDQRQELVYEALVLATAIEVEPSNAASAFPKVLGGLALLNILPATGGSTRPVGQPHAITPIGPPSNQAPVETGPKHTKAQPPRHTSVKGDGSSRAATRNRHESISDLRARERSCRENGNIHELKHVLIDLARALRERGDAERALPHLEEAERHSRDTEDGASLSASLSEQASAYVDLDVVPAAMSKLKEHQRVCLELGIDSALQWNLGMQGLLFHDHGDLYRAWEYYARQERICRVMGDHRGLTVSLVSRAVLLAESANRLEDAVRLAQEARTEVAQHRLSDVADWVEEVLASVATVQTSERMSPMCRPPIVDDAPVD